MRKIVLACGIIFFGAGKAHAVTSLDICIDLTVKHCLQDDRSAAVAAQQGVTQSQLCQSMSRRLCEDEERKR